MVVYIRWEDKWNSYANSDLRCSCNLHPMFLSQVTIHLNSGSCSVKEIRMFFFNMTSIWKLFYYSLKEAESMKGIQAALCFPQPKT